jgi:2-dehydro-3-deoxyphosphogluconate aldolase/(4S)-4-hydroxy-2-oxoglutarate aldolase
MQSVVEELGRERAVAILRTNDRRVAERAMAAAVDAGFRFCEFTLSVPDALELVRTFVAPGRHVGVGTVLTEAELDGAVAAGASFVVSPVVDPALIARATGLGVPMLPGCATPTEAFLAHRAGAPLQKLFPAPSPDWIRTVLAPMPFLRFVPTSGVDRSNARAYLDAGAYALGFVKSLFDPRDLELRDYPAIGDRARELLAAVR